jgi:hypothetical protein
LKEQTNLHVSNRDDRAFVAPEVTTRSKCRQGNSLKKTKGCALKLRSMSHLFDEFLPLSNSNLQTNVSDESLDSDVDAPDARRTQLCIRRTCDRHSHPRQRSAQKKEMENRGENAAIGNRAYFLWRCRFSNLRCLCFRIFLRRFLITLPNGFLPCIVSSRPLRERAKV